MRHLTDDAGIRQFLDIGTGIPNPDNVQGLAQATAPESRIVYVDNDPVVLAHAHTLLNSTPPAAQPGRPGNLRHANPRPGATPRRTNFSQLWKAAAIKAGIDPAVGLHFHDLRHTGNQLTKGAHLKDVMRRLGHSSTRAALIYQHPDRDSERAIAAGLSDTISAALADASGHVAGTAAPDVASGTPPDDQREVG